MPIRAENDPKFSRRFLYMGIAAFGFALWCLYDGAITYPNQRVRGLRYKELQETVGSDPVAFRDQWREIATKNDWPLAYPGEPKEHGEIIMQYIMAGLAATIGLWLISIPLRARGRWIEAGDDGLTSSWGQSLNYDQIRSLNKRQWRSKGIARITYHDGRRNRSFVIDDYKFQRHAADAILYDIEQRIDPSLITGGPPEPPPGESLEPAAEQYAVEEQGEHPA